VRLEFVGLTVLSVVLLGCSRDLSRSQAAALITKHDSFTDTGIWIPVGNGWWSDSDWEPIAGGLKLLRDAGVLTFKESGQRSSHTFNPPANEIRLRERLVQLTAMGQKASERWKPVAMGMPEAESYCQTEEGFSGPCHPARGKVYFLVLARRKLYKVLKVETNLEHNEAKAEFTWEWDRTNDGKAFFPNRFRPGEHKGYRMIFHQYDGRWKAEVMSNSAYDPDDLP
jgi:hypothetical protein